MHLRLVALLPVCLLLAAAQAAPPPTPALEHRLVAAFAHDQAALETYTHREHVVTGKNGVPDGRTLLVWYVQGRPVSETVALDSRPLSADELAAEHARACQRALQAAQRKPPPLGVLEFGGHAYPFARLARDYLYTRPRTIIWNGRSTWVYDAVPNPGVHSRSREETLLLHSRGVIYVDAQDEHIARMSLRSTSDVRYGLGVLATIHEANFLLQLQRHAPGVWLPAEIGFHLRATVLLFDHLTRSKQQSFFDYRLVADPAARPCSG